MSFTLRSPSELVRDAIMTCPANEKARGTINMVPALFQLCENLARMLCDVVPTRDGKEPLLHACIRDAMEHFRDAEKRSDDMTMRIAAFARGLTARLDEFNEVRVYVRVGASLVPWKPSPETLHEFLSRYPGHIPHVVSEAYADVDARTCRQFIAARVIDLAQMNAMGGSLDRIVAVPERIA